MNHLLHIYSVNITKKCNVLLCKIYVILFFIWRGIYCKIFVSTVFSFFDTWKFISRFIFSLMRDTFSAFFVQTVMFVLFFWKSVKCLFCLWCSIFNDFRIRIEVCIYSKSNYSFVNLWGIHSCPTCT